MGLLIGIILCIMVLSWDSVNRHHDTFTSLLSSVGQLLFLAGCVLVAVIYIGKGHQDKRPGYTAVVKNADGTETAYDVKAYYTKDNTMTLTLKDGTKVFVPITNITISEQTTETTSQQ